MYQSFSPFMVEVRGVDPLSEGMFTGLSSSEAFDLGFPSSTAQRQAIDYGSFIFAGDGSKLCRTRAP